MKNITQLLIILLGFYCFSQDGQLDGSFNPTLNLNNSVRTIIEQPDGKILIGGWFTTSGSHKIIRLNEDGSEDGSFNHVSGFNGSINALAIQSDNKIIVGGGYPAFLKRVNEDGTLDSSFNAAVDVDGRITSIKIVSDNKIMVAGIFNNINGVSIQSLARLNTDGSVDTSFNANLPPVTFIWDFEIQTDNKIIISGQNDAGNQYRIFTRYNSNGSIDSTFLADGLSADSYIYDLEIDKDGKILISGPFNNFNYNTRYSLARLNNNGTLDNTFNSYNLPHNGTTHTIFGVRILDDGKYFINGTFSEYDGIESNSIAKINNDGTIDNSFNIGTGPNQYVWNSYIQQDGKILIGGDFTEYNGTAINRIARLGNTILSTDENTFVQEILVYPNPFKNFINIDNTNNANILVSIYNLTGQIIKTETVNQFKTMDTQALSSGIYFAHISDGKNLYIAKLVKK